VGVDHGDHAGESQGGGELLHHFDVGYGIEENGCERTVNRYR
jgi:hypothetical protein